MLSQQYQDNINALREKIEEAEAIVVGGAAGMSAADGHNWYQTTDTFLKYFGKFADKYGIDSIFNGFYHRFSTREERWAYIATLNKFVYETDAGQSYHNLFQLLQGKNYFIVTTNQDILFSKTFPEEKVATIQGDWRYYQCSGPCHDQVYFNKKQVENMYASVEGTSIPNELIPVCPKCGEDLEPWVRSFVFLEGTKFRDEHRKYHEFLLENQNKKVLFLELGVGQMTPMFIKEPFWNMTYSWPDAYYITINPKDALLPGELKDKGLAIHEDIAQVLRDALVEQQKESKEGAV